MKKILFWLAALLVAAGVAFVVYPRHAKEFSEPKVQAALNLDQPVVQNQDLVKIDQLDKFFAKHKCVYKNSGVYVATANKYQLDYRLLPAISVIEEQCGKYNPGNNLFGYGSTVGLKKFPSIEDGIDYVGFQLANNHYYKNKTLKQKLYAYNSVNPNYYSEITSLMNEMTP